MIAGYFATTWLDEGPKTFTLLGDNIVVFRGENGKPAPLADRCCHRTAKFDDDGETFDYERGQCSWTQLRVTRGSEGHWFGNVTPSTSGNAWHYRDVTWKFMTAP